MATSDNWIKQINLGGNVTYDIAVAHGLKFKTGNNTQTWDGVSDVEVVIPTLDQLISDPIRFAGTVGSNGTAVDHDDNALTPAKGDLVFITANCTFNNEACEAGDMAVYDGSAWHVVSGENQVTIKDATPTAVSANKTEVELSATAKTVLDVEGKELVLKLPATLVKNNLAVEKNADKEIALADGNASPDAVFLALTYTPAAQATTLGQNKSVAVPTALTDGTVTFTGDTALVKPGDIAAAWTAGVSGSHESAAVEFGITGAVDLTAGAGNDFVTGWTPSSDAFVQSALKSASLKVVTSVSQDETIATNPYLISNPTFTNDSTPFGTAISAVSTGADFTIPGAISISASSAKPASDGIVLDVTLPTLSDDTSFTDVSYASADASTGVIATIADPTVTINNGSVITSASVSDGVLIITPGTVSATATQGAVTYKKAQYKKTVVSNTPGVSYGTLVTASGQGYKLNTQAVNATFTDGAVGYMGVQTADVSAADKANAYTGLTATTGAYTGALASTAKGNIAAGNVITAVTEATLPVLSTVTATGSIAGSVSTALTTSNVTVAEFAEGGDSINIGTWALASVNSSTEGAIMVAATTDMSVTGTITITAGTYVTDVYADADLAGAPAISSTDRVSVLTPTA